MHCSSYVGRDDSLGAAEEPRRPNMRESVKPHVADPSTSADDKPEAPIAIEETEPVHSVDGRSFHIDFYYRQGHYRGRIALLGSDRKRVLKGVDAAAIADFISQYLPPLPRERAVATFFDEIRLLQRSRVVGRGEPLRAWKRFCIYVRWNIPSAQIVDTLDEYDNTYAVQVWILDEKQRHIVASNAEGGTLQPGFGSQAISIDMAGLQPANYFIKIQMLSPFSRVKENTIIVLRVEP